MSLFIDTQFMESDDAGHKAIEGDENEFTFILIIINRFYLLQK